MRILTDLIFLLVPMCLGYPAISPGQAEIVSLSEIFKCHVRLMTCKAQHMVQYNSASNELTVGILSNPEQTL